MEVHFHEYITTFLLYFTSFFSIINPLGSIPVFMSMTANFEERQRRATARKATLMAFIILVVFALTGQILFKVFGISANGFRVAGGVIFFVMGYDMLNARISRMKIKKKDVREYVEDISITPLGIPILAGPGAITNSIVLMEDASGFDMKIILILSMLVTIIITLISWYSAGKIMKVIGETGNKIMMKLMGLIVMVIAVEFMVAGLTPIIREIFMITPG